ncbi:MAG: hypothetical protein A3K12_16525 [Candidatus Rokubacteria bacterium RIFCSPLOWO2_12_FULL_71_19]|nr:MAG: hypothetical protein A3K12_16525 [Candidatus Rokubacteria bacterium RIFCSPLOWO2_12_FULL_71_19]
MWVETAGSPRAKSITASISSWLSEHMTVLIPSSRFGYRGSSGASSRQVSMTRSKEPDRPRSASWAGPIPSRESFTAITLFRQCAAISSVRSRISAGRSPLVGYSMTAGRVFS